VEEAALWRPGQRCGVDHEWDCGPHGVPGVKGRGGHSRRRQTCEVHWSGVQKPHLEGITMYCSA
jgi:hypothetical protein